MQAETHVSNVALQELLKKHGFTLEGPMKGIWPYYVLRKELPRTVRERTDGA